MTNAARASPAFNTPRLGIDRALDGILRRYQSERSEYLVHTRTVLLINHVDDIAVAYGQVSRPHRRSLLPGGVAAVQLVDQAADLLGLFDEIIMIGASC